MRAGVGVVAQPGRCRASTPCCTRSGTARSRRRSPATRWSARSRSRTPTCWRPSASASTAGLRGARGLAHRLARRARPPGALVVAVPSLVDIEPAEGLRVVRVAGRSSPPRCSARGRTRGARAADAIARSGARRPRPRGRHSVAIARRTSRRLAVNAGHSAASSRRRRARARNQPICAAGDRQLGDALRLEHASAAASRRRRRARRRAPRRTPRSAPPRARPSGGSAGGWCPPRAAARPRAGARAPTGPAC